MFDICTSTTEHLHCSDGIAQGIAVMGISAWINDDAVILPRCAVDQIDKHAFMIGLVEVDVSPPRFRQFPKPLFDLRQGLRAVHTGLTHPKQIEVGTIQHQDTLHDHYHPYMVQNAIGKFIKTLYHSSGHFERKNYLSI